MSDLSGYTVTFARTPLGLWTWRGIDPSGREFGSPLGGAYIGKAGAERDALREIERRESKETLTGVELQERVK